MGPHWYPPTSLTGRHWRVELRHVDGTWSWYTEHLTEHDAQTFCNYKQEYHPRDSWRVVEVTR
jgi:hypothetical protein